MDKMEQIYRSHAKTVYAFLLTKTQNPDLAEELTQETFYQAVKNIHKFKEKSSVSTWLCAIAKHLWYEHLRKQKAQNALTQSEAAGELQRAEGLSADSAEAEVFRSWEQLEILKLLHGLGEPMREVMYLRLIGNLTFRQIGEIVDKSENWARVTYYRGKEKIVKEAKL